MHTSSLSTGSGPWGGDDLDSSHTIPEAAVLRAPVMQQASHAAGECFAARWQQKLPPSSRRARSVAPSGTRKQSPDENDAREQGFATLAKTPVVSPTSMSSPRCQFKVSCFGGPQAHTQKGGQTEDDFVPAVHFGGSPILMLPPVATPL